MLRGLKNQSNFERDLVTGYYRLNSKYYYIPHVVTQLSMMFLWILDEFENDSAVHHRDIDNEVIDHDDIKISGLNRTVASCTYGGVTSFVFGRNIISSKVAYHHWRFQINYTGINEKGDDEDEYDFIIGVQVVPTNIYCKDLNYSFIGSHGLLMVDNGLQTFTNRKFHQKNDILDMYLNLKGSYGELSYVVNNEKLGVAHNKLDITKKYRMSCALTNKYSTVELIDYHSSNGHQDNMGYLPYTKYIGSIPMIEDKILHLETLMNEYNINKSVANDYIDCLVMQKEYKKCYQFLDSRNFQIDIESVNNVRKIGSYFYFQDHSFDKAMKIWRLIKDDDVLRDQHITVELAFCYEQNGKQTQNNKQLQQEYYGLALKYYEMSLKYESKLEDHGRSEILHHLGAIYFNQMANYQKALQCFLKMDITEIANRDLESVILNCYDQMKQYEIALRFFKKYELKYKHKPSVIIAIASIYWKMNDPLNADRYFHKALSLEIASSNWMIHSKYGYYLLNYKKDYFLALKYFNKSLDIATNPHQLSESYKCIGATYDKLGDMDRAIMYTDKVLEINETDADALNNAGYFYLTKREYSKAYDYLVRSLEILPEGDLTTGNIGICLYEMGRYNEALPFLRKVINELPVDLGHPDVGPAVLYCYAKILLNEKKDYEEMIKILQQLLNHKEFDYKYGNNKADEIYYLLSRACSKLMDFDSSLKYLKKAKELNPGREIYQNQIQIIKNSMVPNV